MPSSIKVINNNKHRVTSLALDSCLLGKNAVDDFLSFFNLPQGEPNVLFKADASLDEEDYILRVGEVIEITSSGKAGQLYALQTLRQIIFQCDFIIPEIEICDKPKYKIRGFMLDVGRYFFPVSDVKKIIRRMAWHKLNLLHLHLTEDQGWRVEIKKYPLLTEIGSKRAKTNFNHTAHQGFYTQQDIREIVSYAHEFCISVMPEFDIPGHSRSAIACYSDLTCFPRRLPVADHWGVKHDVLCVGRDSTMEFVKNVIDEMCDLFPDKYFHIGGDEVPKHRWSLCPDCQAKIRRLGLNDCDELQIWFMNEVNSYLAEKGRQSFMWSWDLKNDNMLDSTLGFTKCGELDTGDRPFIDTSTVAYYIDLPYGYISLDDTAKHKVYNGNCLGVEATLWSEYVPDMKKADFMTFPRLAPLCEAGWRGEADVDSINDRLDFYYSYLKALGCGFADIKTANPNKIRGKLQVLWFERRQLAWEGLTNIIDDKRIEALAKKKKR